jgi:hypothetical protein
VKFEQKYPETLNRYERFWSGAETDRPVMYMSFPKENPDGSVKPPEYAEPIDRLKPEVMLARARYKLATTDYHAEGFPHWFVNYGPGVLHACLTGGDLHVRDERTIWFPHFLEELEDFEKLDFEAEGKWWSTILESTRLLLAEVGEEMVISYTDIGGGGDILASARGTEAFLLDCAMKPEVVRAAMKRVNELWLRAFESNHRALSEGQDVFSPWYRTLSAGRTYMTQCDFNAMIGPDMFADLFAPDLAGIYSTLDHSAFHLDGLNTEHHVPALIEAGVDCIQWTPGPIGSPLKHIEMLKEIQAAGRAVTIGVGNERELETVCRELDHRRLLLLIEGKSVCPDRQTAEKLVETALRFCEKKG